MKNVLFIILASFVVLISCQKTTPVKTIANLKAGITGETTASAKYAAYSKKAQGIPEGGHEFLPRRLDRDSPGEGQLVQGMGFKGWLYLVSIHLFHDERNGHHEGGANQL